MNFIKKNSLWFVLIIGALGVLASAYFEGNATMRWGQEFDQHLQSFKDAVENAIPTQVGIWTADSTEDHIGIENELIRKVAGADGALARHYRGSYDMPDVHVNITCGFSRTVGAHTPDVCFTGSGSNQDSEVESYEVTYEVNVPNPEKANEFLKEERTASFKTALFSDQGNHYQQRVFWGWKGMNSGWVAPRFPRLKWNSSEPICKMYVSIMEDRGILEGGTDSLKTAEEFLKVFLPELDKILTGTYVLPENLKVPASKTEVTENADSAAASPSGSETAAPGAPADEFDLAAPTLSIPETAAPAAESPAETAPTTPKTAPAEAPALEVEDGLTAPAAKSKAPKAKKSKKKAAKAEVTDEFTL